MLNSLYKHLFIFFVYFIIFVLGQVMIDVLKMSAWFYIPIMLCIWGVRRSLFDIYGLWKFWISPGEVTLPKFLLFMLASILSSLLFHSLGYV